MKKHTPNAAVPSEYYVTRFRVPDLPARWPEVFTIVTAWPPTGESWTTERIDTADESLARILGSSGRWHHRITGYDPSGDHAEPGWAIEQTLQEGLALARQFQQLGFYVVEDGELWLVMCAGPGERSRVAQFFDRLDDPFPSAAPSA